MAPAAVEVPPRCSAQAGDARHAARKAASRRPAQTRKLAVRRPCAFQAHGPHAPSSSSTPPSADASSAGTIGDLTGCEPSRHGGPHHRHGVGRPRHQRLLRRPRRRRSVPAPSPRRPVRVHAPARLARARCPRRTASRGSRKDAENRR